MTKLFYTNGDSFVYGMECLGHTNRSQQNKLQSFPNEIRLALGYESYMNNSYLGATNDFIFTQTLLDLEKLKKQGFSPDNVFVLIGWTSLFRIEIDGDRWLEQIPGSSNWVDKNQYSEDFPKEYTDYETLFVNVSSGLMIDNAYKFYDIRDSVVPFCAKYLWTDTVMNPQQDARIFAMDAYLKSQGYRYLFVNTVFPFPKLKYTDCSSTNYYDAENGSFLKFATENYPEEKREHHHFSSVPHQAYAQLLINHIKNYGL